MDEFLGDFRKPQFLVLDLFVKTGSFILLIVLFSSDKSVLSSEDSLSCKLKYAHDIWLLAFEIDNMLSSLSQFLDKFSVLLNINPIFLELSFLDEFACLLNIESLCFIRESKLYFSGDKGRETNFDSAWLILFVKRF